MSAIDLALSPVRDETKRVADVGEVERWLAAAKQGDRLHYATRSYLPTGAPGPRRLRALSDQGLVLLFQKRSDLLLGEFCYFAQRTGVASPVEAPIVVGAQRPQLSAREADAGDYQAGDLLYPILKRAAEFGRPCPTDKQLSIRAGISVFSVEDGLLALRSAKLIAIHSAPAPTLRRVTILETGAQTGLAA
ncbi:hypothetical protein [Sphingomonas adhaesiva]|uniref:hypothetical protein n=1 Tax=Sphingomonas adhaesiva TaxID=28212 RepID=UPI002FFB91A1